MYLLQLVQALKYENFTEIKKALPKKRLVSESKDESDKER